jgi:hypothetical protein
VSATTTERFGDLEVLRDDGVSRAGKRMVVARCTCGAEVRVVLSNLRSGNTTNCGCARKASLRARNAKHGHTARGARSREYKAWVNMWLRVDAPPGTRWHRFYGARGVTACERWRDFAAFLADVGPCPSPELTLDRIDPHGNYEPGNVRWASWAVQRANRRAK